MGLISKIKKLFSKKVSKQIEEKNEAQSFVKQTKFDSGLKHASNALNSSINDIAKNFRKVDQNLIDEIEESLISFDIGSAATKKIITSIVDEIKLQNVTDGELVKQIILDKLFVYYIQDTDTNTQLNIRKGELNTILVSGVNGVGKTTSVAKLANFLKNEGHSVCLIAADTFRAGAIAQLEEWSNRLGIKIFKPLKEQQDPASVVYEGMKFASENHIDVVLCDTSGRLQNKSNLMNELKKIDSVIKKFKPNEPCESLLVIDATTGQNGLLQAKSFNEITKITGIVLTKMDSSSKGGIVLAIKDTLNLPIKFIGLGESINDLEPFDLESYINGMISKLNLTD